MDAGRLERTGAGLAGAAGQCAVAPRGAPPRADAAARRRLANRGRLRRHGASRPHARRRNIRLLSQRAHCIGKEAGAGAFRARRRHRSDQQRGKRSLHRLRRSSGNRRRSDCTPRDPQDLARGRVEFAAMRRTLILALALFAPSLFAKGTTVKFDSLAGKGSGYLVEPAGKGKHPGLIVIQEWWGLNDWIKDQAERYAGEGFVVIAPDLYRGKVATTADEAHELMRGLPQDRAIADLKAAFGVLAKRSDVDKKRIGVIGWCMGGGYALDFTLAEPKIAATVINYGHLMADPASVAKIHAPIL